MNIVQWHPDPNKAGIQKHAQYNRAYSSTVIDIVKQKADCKTGENGHAN